MCVCQVIPRPELSQAAPVPRHLPSRLTMHLAPATSRACHPSVPEARGVSCHHSPP